MTSFLSLVGRIVLSCLPPRYRRDAALQYEAMVSGFLEMLVALGIVVFRFFIFSWRRDGFIGTPVNTASNLPEVNAVFGGGIFMMAEFVIQPVSIVLLYFVLEGGVRFISAWVSEQVIGTLPFYLIGRLHGLAENALHRRYLGPVLMDEVVRGRGIDYDLKVYTSRPKLHWNPYMTIEFEGEFYQMFREEPSNTPRRFSYYLRKNPIGRIIVTIDHYKVDQMAKSGFAHKVD